MLNPVPPAVVDCAEGTLRQFALQPHHDARRVKLPKLSKIFITHMHGACSLLTRGSR